MVDVAKVCTVTVKTMTILNSYDNVQCEGNPQEQNTSKMKILFRDRGRGRISDVAQNTLTICP